MISLFTTTLLFLLLLQCPSLVQGKASSGQILLTGEKSEAVLTKFAIGPRQTGTFHLHLHIPNDKGMYMDERYLRVHVFLDNTWHKKAGKAPTCEQKVSYADHYKAVTFDVADAKKFPDDRWVADVEITLDNSDLDRKRFYYLTLDDCSLEQYFRSIEDAPEMKYSYTIQNVLADGSTSHYSADQEGLTKLHFISLIISALLLLRVFYKIVQNISASRGQVHIALFIVAMAIIFDILSNLSELIHSSVYSRNGIGSYSFDCFASHFEAVCDSLVATVLLFVGSGWTLPTDMVITEGGQNLSMMGTHTWVQRLVLGLRSPTMAFQEIQSGNPAAVLVLLVVLAHIILAQWGRTYDDEFDTYHSLEHRPGTILMFLRATLGLAFLVSIASVRNSGRCPRALNPFLTKFMVVGLSWFASLPFVSMFISSALPYHWKHQGLALGSTIVQASSLCSLVWLFTADSDASAYHRLSNVQQENSRIGDMSLGDTGGSGISSSSTGSSSIWKFGKTKVRLD